MAAKYWCEFCQRVVPKHKQNVTGQVALLWIMLFLGGFLTCGFTWLLMILLPFIQLGAAVQTKCPICQANTKKATTKQIAQSRST